MSYAPCENPFAKHTAKMKSIVCIWFLFMISFIVGDSVVRKPGYCSVRYNRGMFLKNNIKAPLITGKTLKYFKEMCPYLADAKSDNIHGCCDLDTLLYAKEAFYQTQRLFSECPACVRNIQNIYCEFLCSPNQAMHTRQNNWYQVYFYVTSKLVDGLYGSCRDVTFTGTTDKSISLFCDSDISKCTPAKLLSTLKIVNQPHFKIDELDPTLNMTMNNKTMIRCNESFTNPITGKQSSRCSCENCRDSCTKPVVYETLEIKVRSTVHLPVDNYAPYQKKAVNFSGVVHKDVLKKVLTLQQNLTAITATDNKKTVTLKDVCHKPTENNDDKNCAVYSPLQYYGLLEKNLDKCATNMMEDCNDPDAFGDRAQDWHDQFFQCTRTPASITIFLRMSCWSNFGVPIHPRHVLSDYGMDRYTEAASFKIKLLLDTNTIEEERTAMIWQKAAIKYLGYWSQYEAPKQQLSITYYTSSMSKSIVQV